MEPLDSIDRRIFEELREDGRRPYTQIAQSVGLTEGAVRRRVARLIKKNVLRITAATNPMEMGYLTATLGIKVQGGKAKAVAGRLALLPQVDFLAHTIGVFDLAVGLVCQDRAELYDVVVKQVREIDGVIDTSAYLHLDIVKNLYGW